jgi:putative peptidoglycan lipid II flippase
MLIFTGIAYSLTGILQSLDEFTIPAAMSIVSNGIIIFYFVFINKSFGVFGLAIAFLIGWAMQAVIQIPSLRKKGYRYRPRLNIKDEGIKKVGLLMLPVMVSTWVQPINVVVNTKLASHLNGGIGALEYSNTLYTIIAGTFVLSVANVIFPELSRLTEDKDQFGITLGTTLKGVFFLLIPMMVGIIVLSEPIVRLVYERGEFDAYSTLITANALKYFSIGMLGFGMQNILNRGFYATQDGKTPLITGLISIVVNLVLSIVLVRVMAINGLALASAISSIILGLMLLIPMQKRLGGIVTSKSMMDILKMLLVAVIMAIVVIVSYRIISNVLIDTFINRVIMLAIPTLLGVVVYMILSYSIGLEEAKIAFGFVGKYVKRK